MFEAQQIVERVEMVDLSTPGAVSIIQNCTREIHGDTVKLAKLLASGRSGNFTFGDDRWLMFFGLLLQYSPSEAISKCICESRGYSADHAKGVLCDGLVRIIEHSWIGSSDLDAVDSHYWGCGQLIKLVGAGAESILLDRLLVQEDTQKKQSLVFALGVLSHAASLRRLRPETVMVIHDILVDNNAPSDVRSSAYEVIAEDLLPVDSETPFLPASIRNSLVSALSLFQRLQDPME